MSSISVIIPCFNIAEFLAEAITSVIEQERPVDEILVVDDCSTDGSREVARQFPVTLLQTKRNSGHATARNLGIEHASGDLIAWLDADDRFDREHIQVVCGLLDQHPNAAVAFSGVRRFGLRTNPWTGFPCSAGPTNVFWDCFRRTIVPAMSAVTRRTALQDVGGFDAKFRIAPDFDLWLRLSREHLFVSTDATTSNYRVHENQISKYARWDQKRSLYAARSKLLTTVRQEGNMDLATALTQKMVGIWDADLTDAWHLRDFTRLQFLLSLECFLPETTATSRRCRKFAKLPAWMIRTWDLVQRYAKLQPSAIEKSPEMY